MAEINYLKVDTLPNVEGNMITFVDVYATSVSKEFQNAYKNATDVGYNTAAFELLRTEWNRRWAEKMYYEEKRKKALWITVFALTALLLVLLLITDAVHNQREREKKTETIEYVSETEIVDSVS